MCNVGVNLCETGASLCRTGVNLCSGTFFPPRHWSRARRNGAVLLEDSPRDDFSATPQGPWRLVAGIHS